MPTFSAISSWRTRYVRSISPSGSRNPASCSMRISASLARRAASLYFSSTACRLLRSFLSLTLWVWTALPRPYFFCASINRLFSLRCLVGATAFVGADSAMASTGLGIPGLWSGYSRVNEAGKIGSELELMIKLFCPSSSKQLWRLRRILIFYSAGRKMPRPPFRMLACFFPPPPNFFNIHRSILFILAENFVDRCYFILLLQSRRSLSARHPGLASVSLQGLRRCQYGAYFDCAAPPPLYHQDFAQALQNWPCF